MMPYTMSVPAFTDEMDANEKAAALRTFLIQHCRKLEYDLTHIETENIRDGDETILAEMEELREGLDSLAENLGCQRGRLIRKNSD